MDFNDDVRDRLDWVLTFWRFCGGNGRMTIKGVVNHTFATDGGGQVMHLSWVGVELGTGRMFQGSRWDKLR